MSKNYSLKDIVLMSLTLIVIASAITFYVHLSLVQRQAEREIIYIRARAMAAEQQRARTLEYQKKLEENRLNREFRQSGKVVNLVRE